MPLLSRVHYWIVRRYSPPAKDADSSWQPFFEDRPSL